MKSVSSFSSIEITASDAGPDIIRSHLLKYKISICWIKHICTLYLEFHIHTISLPLIELCKVSMAKTIKTRMLNAL